MELELTVINTGYLMSVEVELTVINTGYLMSVELELTVTNTHGYLMSVELELTVINSGYLEYFVISYLHYAGSDVFQLYIITKTFIRYPYYDTTCSIFSCFHQIDCCLLSVRRFP